MTLRGVSFVMFTIQCLTRVCYAIILSLELSGDETPLKSPPSLAKMDDYDEELMIILLLALRRRKNKKKRSCWVRPIFTLRRQQGNLLQEMRLLDTESHFRYLRMSRDRFDCLLAEVSLAI